MIFNVGPNNENMDIETMREQLHDVRIGDLEIGKMTRSEQQALRQLLTPKMTHYIPHAPTPKQSAFLLLDSKEAFYGGAAGGGKSDALLMGGLQYVDIKGYAGILFRKTYADLTKPAALIDRSKEWLNQFADVVWRDKEKKFEFIKGYGPHKEVWSILQFGYMETDNDRFNYQGGEYQYIGFDELTHFSETCYTYMFSRLRRLKNTPIPLRVRGASNPPDDDQGQWVYDRFVNPEKRKPGAVFISAGLSDNPYLDKDAYEEALEELDPITRARLRDGNWTVVRKGNMFKREWFDYVDRVSQARKIVRFWDMAATEETGKVPGKRKKDPDYTVGFKMSVADGIYVIEDIIRKRMRPADTEKLQKDTADVDGFNVSIREEQEPGSSGIATIDSKARSLFIGMDYSGIRTTGSKSQRAQAVSAAAERGQVKILQGCPNVDAFFNELESFPGGSHDDMVDGLSGAFVELRDIPEVTLPIGIDSEGSYWREDESYGSFWSPNNYPF